MLFSIRWKVMLFNCSVYYINLGWYLIGTCWTITSKLTQFFQNFHITTGSNVEAFSVWQSEAINKFFDFSCSSTWLGVIPKLRSVVDAKNSFSLFGSNARRFGFGCKIRWIILQKSFRFLDDNIFCVKSLFTAFNKALRLFLALRNIYHVWWTFLIRTDFLRDVALDL